MGFGIITNINKLMQTWWGNNYEKFSYMVLIVFCGNLTKYVVKNVVVISIYQFPKFF